MVHARLAALAFALLACSAPRSTPAHGVPARSGPWSLEVVDESGRALPTFQHRGRTYVLGTHGARYLLRIRNQSGGRIEVVASVDGRDVVDGRPASVTKPGYLVDPWGEVTIDGFRLSTEAPRRVALPEPYPVPYAGKDADARGEAESRQAPAEAAAPASGAKAAGDLARSGSEKSRRPGLGTGFGEAHESRVVEVAFERASAAPAAVLTVRYDDRRGLLALGIDVDGPRVSRQDRDLRAGAEPFRSDGFAEPPPGWSGR